VTASTATLAPNWQDRALCGNYDPAWWDLHPGNLTAFNRKALDICGRCQVPVQCAAYLRPDDIGFIRAGYPVRERREAKTLAEAGRARLGLDTPTGQAAAGQPKPAPAPGRPDCTAPSYGSHKRHIMNAQEPCAACKAFVTAADRVYRERRREAS
jgi:hypothetical protein